MSTVEKREVVDPRLPKDLSTDREKLTGHLIEARFLARDNGLVCLDSMLAMAMDELIDVKVP